MGASTIVTSVVAAVVGCGNGSSANPLGPAAASGPPGRVSELRVATEDRRDVSFRLSWVAPTRGGAALAGYDVRVSEEPIDDEREFDAGERVPFTGALASPGVADGAVAHGLFLGHAYYFAVAPRGVDGTRGPFAAVGPVRASFRTTSFTGAPDELFGYSSDGSTDLNGDGFADLLVGAGASKTVRLYWGGRAGFRGTPDVTFTGPATEFGVAVRVIGDIDSDGVPDIGIGSDLEQRVYVFLGRTLRGATQSPATLDASQADLVVEADPTVEPAFAGSLFGAGLAGVGDVDGDGVDDFAIGAPRYAGGKGWLAIVGGKARPTAVPKILSFPAAIGPGARVIEGDAAGGRFGAVIAAVGKVTGARGASFVTSAARADDERGRVYAFTGPLRATRLSASEADQVVTSQVPKSRFGVTLGLVAGASGTQGPMLAVGAPGLTHDSAFLRLYQGSSERPRLLDGFSVLTDSKASADSDRFGYVVLGGAFAGRGAAASFIGDPTPDLVVSSIFENGGAPVVYFLDGRKLAHSGDVATPGLADVTYRLPADWAGSAFDCTAIHDLDGDGHPDLAIGEFSPSQTGSGRVIVLW